MIRAIRDYFHPDIGEILIDTDDIFEQAQQFMAHVMPDNVQPRSSATATTCRCSRASRSSTRSRPRTRAGDPALGRRHRHRPHRGAGRRSTSTRRAPRAARDIEETAFRTNLEAADEIARQLRLRDLGGLIVIDFIDMEEQRNQREVENRLRDALHYDRARVQMGKISRFGLMELSRQRLRPALGEGSHITCPRCNGIGHIRDTESPRCTSCASSRKRR